MICEVILLVASNTYTALRISTRGIIACKQVLVHPPVALARRFVFVCTEAHESFLTGKGSAIMAVFMVIFISPYLTPNQDVALK